MNQTYLKYGLIAAAVVVVLYALMRGRASTQAQASNGGALAVDVQYSQTSDQSGGIAARSQAFSELVGLSGLVTSETLANETARGIAASEERVTKYGLNIGQQVEEMRLRGAREMAEFQASQVNFAAESYRNKDKDRMASYLNALTSIWGAAPVYAPQRESTASNIVSSIANAASKFFTFGFGG